MRKRKNLISPLSGEGDFMSKEIEEAPERTETDFKTTPNFVPTLATQEKKLSTQALDCMSPIEQDRSVADYLDVNI